MVCYPALIDVRAYLQNPTWSDRTSVQSLRGGHGRCQETWLFQLPVPTGETRRSLLLDTPVVLKLHHRLFFYKLALLTLKKFSLSVSLRLHPGLQKTSSFFGCSIRNYCCLDIFVRMIILTNYINGKYFRTKNAAKNLIYDY